MSRYPWDTKLVSELSEDELYKYAYFLHVNGALDRQRNLDRLVQMSLSHLKNLRLSASPHTSSCGRVTLPYRGVEQAYRPYRGVEQTYRTLVVQAPIWLEDEVMEYIVREQLTEQLDGDQG